MSTKHNPKVAEYPARLPCSNRVHVNDVVFLPVQGVYVCRRCRWQVAEAVMVGVMGDCMATWIHTKPEPTEA